MLIGWTIFYSIESHKIALTYGWIAMFYSTSNMSSKIKLIVEFYSFSLQSFWRNRLVIHFLKDVLTFKKTKTKTKQTFVFSFLRPR